MQLQIDFDYDKVQVPNPPIKELSQSDIDFMLEEFQWILEGDIFQEEDGGLKNFTKLKEP